MDQKLLFEIAVAVLGVVSAWAVMRVQLQRALKDIEDLRGAIEEIRQDMAGKAELATLNALVTKVSLQVAYLNGQLGARGLVPPSIPPDLKTP